MLKRSKIILILFLPVILILHVSRGLISTASTSVNYLEELSNTESNVIVTGNGDEVLKEDSPIVQNVEGTIEIKTTESNADNYINESAAILNTESISNNIWRTRTNFPFTSTGYNASTTMHDLIYITNGNELYEYNPNTNLWSKRANMQRSKSPQALVVVNERIYAVGGLARDYNPIDGYSEDEYPSIEEYNPVTNTWVFKTLFYTTVKYDSSIEVINGLIYIAGGNEGIPVTDSDIYNPVTNTFVGCPQMLNLRDEKAASAVLDGKIYVAGGLYNNSVEMYNPQTGKWSLVASMNTPRCNFDMVSYNGKLYAIGGFDGIDALDSIEVYNPATDSWTSYPDTLSAPKYLFDAFLLNDEIYIVGGDLIGDKTIQSFKPKDVSESANITYEYDLNGRLVRIYNNGVLKASFEYDKNGNLLRINN